MIKNKRWVAAGLAALVIGALACKEGDSVAPKNETPGTKYTYELSGRYTGEGVTVRSKKTLRIDWKAGGKHSGVTQKSSFSKTVTSDKRSTAIISVQGGRGGGKVECKIIVKRDGREIAQKVKSGYGKETCSA